MLDPFGPVEPPAEIPLVWEQLVNDNPLTWRKRLERGDFLGAPAWAAPNRIIVKEDK